MIVCVVDDLLFSVKISTAARAAGADVFFARHAGQVLATIRDRQPSLVILDLNSAKLQPLEVIAAMKADADFAGIHTLGFVSHVQTDVIEAARAAGIDEVLARSAFSDKLVQILSRTPATPPAPDRAE